MTSTIRVLFHEDGEFILPDHTSVYVGPSCIGRYIDVPAGIVNSDLFRELSSRGAVEVAPQPEPVNDVTPVPEAEATETAPEVVEEAPEETLEEVVEDDEGKPAKKTRSKKG